MSESFGEAIHLLQSLPPTSASELQEMSQAILNLAKDGPSSVSPRDAKFASYASLLFNGVYPLFIDLQIEDLDHEKTQAAIQRIELYLARRAYDFASHVLNTVGDISQYREIEWAMADLPDMTAWPEEAK